MDTAEQRQREMERIWEKARTIGCDHEMGPVLARGDPMAKLMLIGEAPGAEEVREGRPFAGPAGHLLDRLFAQVGIDRESIWLTNAVKCRPGVMEKGRVRNRPPTAAEQKQWRSILVREIQTVRPERIVCLGAIAARAVLGPQFKLTDERGRWFETEWGIPAMATFHPAYALHLDGPDREHAVAMLLRDLRAAAPPTRGGTFVPERAPATSSRIVEPSTPVAESHDKEPPSTDRVVGPCVRRGEAATLPLWSDRTPLCALDARAGQVHCANRLGDKLRLVQDPALEAATFFAVWPGQWRSDVFIVDRDVLERRAGELAGAARGDVEPELHA